MAYMTELSGNRPAGIPVAENTYSSISRTVTQDPIGAITPNFVGELVFDSANEKTYRARGTTNADWTIALDI